MLIPRRYQVEGIEYLKRQKRAMLYDEPGLGKTLQAAEAAQKPVLVLCPTYLVEQWSEFLQQQYPNDIVVALRGQRMRRTVNLLGMADWYVGNIEMLRTYTWPKVSTLIIDESHRLRSHRAAQSRAAVELAKRVDRVYLLTGTPIVKTADDLFMQFRVLQPDVFTSYNRFVSTFCTTIETPWAIKIVGVKNKYMVRKLIQSVGLGRKYQDVGIQLPPLQEIRMRLDLPGNLKQDYKQLKANYRLQNIAFNNAGAVLHTLRAITACKVKFDALKDLIEDSNQRALVFCWYKETAHALGTLLETSPVTGDVPAPARAGLTKQHHVVATISSLSEGIDLSEFRLVVFFEAHYTPGSMDQAVRRVYRHSDNHAPIRVFYLLMKGTVDEVIVRTEDSRERTIEDVVKESLSALSD